MSDALAERRHAALVIEITNLKRHAQERDKQIRDLMQQLRALQREVRQLTKQKVKSG